MKKVTKKKVVKKSVDCGGGVIIGVDDKAIYGE